MPYVSYSEYKSLNFTYFKKQLNIDVIVGLYT